MADPFIEPVSYLENNCVVIEGMLVPRPSIRLVLLGMIGITGEELPLLVTLPGLISLPLHRSKAINLAGCLSDQCDSINSTDPILTIRSSYWNDSLWPPCILQEESLGANEWLNSLSHCTWHSALRWRTECDEPALDFFDNSAIGATLPPQIGNFRKARKLDFEGKFLGGEHSNRNRPPDFSHILGCPAY
eukprot:scaffold9078_cov129-Cylindrotheca_fusiformis.AAC.4